MTYLLMFLTGIIVAFVNIKDKNPNTKTKIALILSGFIMAEGLTLFLVSNVL